MDKKPTDEKDRDKPSKEEDSKKEKESPKDVDAVKPQTSSTNKPVLTDRENTRTGAAPAPRNVPASQSRNSLRIKLCERARIIRFVTSLESLAPPEPPIEAMRMQERKSTRILPPQKQEQMEEQPSATPEGEDECEVNDKEFAISVTFPTGSQLDLALPAIAIAECVNEDFQRASTFLRLNYPNYYQSLERLYNNESLKPETREAEFKLAVIAVSSFSEEDLQNLEEHSKPPPQ